jgi:hypothetical protein
LLMLLALTYLSCALLATWLSWRRPVAAVGIALAASSIVCSAAFYQIPSATRPILEIVMATLITACAVCAWAAGQWRVARWLVSFALIDVCFCGAFSMHGRFGKPQMNLFDQITNAIFAMQCVCVAAPGIAAHGRLFLDRWVRDVDRRRGVDVGAVEGSIVSQRLPSDMDWLAQQIDGRRG